MNVGTFTLSDSKKKVPGSVPMNGSSLWGMHGKKESFPNVDPTERPAIQVDNCMIDKGIYDMKENILIHQESLLSGLKYLEEWDTV